MQHWNAFCTIFWFITGDKIIKESRHKESGYLYDWYLYRIDGVPEDPCE